MRSNTYSLIAKLGRLGLNLLPERFQSLSLFCLFLLFQLERPEFLHEALFLAIAVVEVDEGIGGARDRHRTDHMASVVGCAC